MERQVDLHALMVWTAFNLSLSDRFVPHKITLDGKNVVSRVFSLMVYLKPVWPYKV